MSKTSTYQKPLVDATLFPMRLTALEESFNEDNVRDYGRRRVVRRLAYKRTKGYCPRCAAPLYDVVSDGAYGPDGEAHTCCSVCCWTFGGETAGGKYIFGSAWTNKTFWTVALREARVLAVDSEHGDAYVVVRWGESYDSGLRVYTTTRKNARDMLSQHGARPS